MNLINPGDIIDAWYKLKLRGLKFMLSKFNFLAKKRTESTFNEMEISSANYWDIPEINKHWNRLITGNFPKVRIDEINKQLSNLPHQFRTKFLSNKVKQKVYVPGLIRMILADPSEAVDSESIRPILKKFFSPIKEVELGGNIL